MKRPTGRGLGGSHSRSSLFSSPGPSTWLQQVKQKVAWQSSQLCLLARWDVAPHPYSFVPVVGSRGSCTQGWNGLRPGTRAGGAATGRPSGQQRWQQVARLINSAAPTWEVAQGPHWGLRLLRQGAPGSVWQRLQGRGASGGSQDTLTAAPGSRPPIHLQLAGPAAPDPNPTHTPCAEFFMALSFHFFGANTWQWVR